MELVFTNLYKCHSQVTFALEPLESGTNVSWSMDGNNDFMAKTFGLIMNVDNMVGKEFEEGLANLNRVATSEGQTARV